MNEIIETEIQYEIESLSQDGYAHIDFEGYSVTLGNNGLYYVGVDTNKETKHIEWCEGDDNCECTRMYPNSYSFRTPIEVTNFIALNLLNHQADYHDEV